MTILTINTPDDDLLELKADEWIHLAIGKNEDKPSLTKTHGNFGTDGYRVHITNAPVCTCGDNELHKSLNDNLIKPSRSAPFLFAINRQYLLDALAGITPQRNIILFFGTSKSPIVVQGWSNDDDEEDTDAVRTALIMPIDVPRTNPFIKSTHIETHNEQVNS